MARILVDVRLHDSVSRLSDIDLTYCNTKRSALICLRTQFSGTERETDLLCRAIETRKKRDLRDATIMK